ncbi:MAGE protein, partial [Backusella circina FSU 941]
EVDRLVKAVVRYALACEFNRKIIRRDDLNKKVLKDKTRLFHTVMSKAKTKLRIVFGMTLAELPVTKSLSHTQMAATQTQTQVSQRGGVTGSGGGGSSGTYILQNILKEDYNEPQIINRSDDEYIKTGILYVVLGIIFANENQMLGAELYSHLDRLHVTQASTTHDARDELISEFIKQKYLIKTKINEQQGDEPEYIFSWGPRAKVELPEQNIVEFMTSFYTLDETQKQAMKNNLYKAAGFDIPS